MKLGNKEYIFEFEEECFSVFMILVPGGVFISCNGSANFVYILKTTNFYMTDFYGAELAKQM